MNKWAVVETGHHNELFVVAPIRLREHRCGVAGCNKGNRKICAHETANYANCGGNHATNSPQYTSRHKADIEARQKKS